MHGDRDRRDNSIEVSPQLIYCGISSSSGVQAGAIGETRYLFVYFIYSFAFFSLLLSVSATAENVRRPLRSLQPCHNSHKLLLLLLLLGRLLLLMLLLLLLLVLVLLS